MSMRIGYCGGCTCLMLCLSCEVKSSKMINRIEGIWFSGLHNAFTKMEDMIKREHYLKRCLRVKAKGLKMMMKKCSALWHGWHLLTGSRDDGRRQKSCLCKWCRQGRQFSG